jgi:hypothetical protein
MTDGWLILDLFNRINERKQRRDTDNKKLAYLLDLKTIALEDLAFGYSLGQVQTDNKKHNNIFSMTAILHFYSIQKG